MYSQSLIDRNRERVEKAFGLKLRESTLPQVVEFENRLRDVEWREGQPSRALSDEEGEFIANELQQCKLSFEYWVNRYGKIINDRGELSPIKLWPSQHKVLDVLAREEQKALSRSPFWSKAKIILLKPRQVGGTVISELILAHMVLFTENTRAVIASDHPDNSRKLWQVFGRIYDNLPGWMRPKRDIVRLGEHMHFAEVESDVVVGAGNQKTTLGQGMTLDAVHLTEMSTWDAVNAFAVDEDLIPAFDSSRKHHSFLLIESTGAGGRGNWFHDQYRIAESGASEFQNLFVSWYMRPTYVGDPEGMTFSETTLSMAQRVKRETGWELTREQLAFYQRKRAEYELKDRLEVFLQEFCSTPDEAFQSGLRSVFGIELRSRVRDKCREPIAVFDVDIPARKLVPDKTWALIPFEKRDPKNKLLIWEWSRPGFLYIAGVDASYGETGGDNASIQVIRAGNKWEPDEQVAEWCGNISPLDLAVPAFLIGNAFPDKFSGLPAKMAVEVNPGSPGIVTQTELMARGYQHFYTWKRPLKMGGGYTKETGWYTSSITRPLITERGVDMIKKGDFLVNSPWLIEEMSSFVNIPNKAGVRHLQHAPGYHDDRLLAAFIALYIAHETDTINVAEDRRQSQELLAGEKPAKVDWLSQGFTEDGRPLTWDEAMAQFEELWT